MDSLELNPFHGLIESSEYPLARFKRTSLGQKIWDSFVVFAGKPPLLVEKPQLGLYDYCTLGIPFLLNQWMTDGLNARKNNPWLKKLVIPLVLLNIPLFLFRCLAAIVLTIIAMPLVGLVHLASHLASRSDKNNIYKTQGHYLWQETTLGKVLEHNHLGLDDLNIEINKDQIVFKPKMPDPDDYPIMGCCYVDMQEPQPIMTINPGLTTSQPYWPSFFALNMANSLAEPKSRLQFKS